MKRPDHTTRRHEGAFAVYTVVSARFCLRSNLCLIACNTHCVFLRGLQEFTYQLYAVMSGLMKPLSWPLLRGMNQSQNSTLSYRPDGGVNFKQQILGWLLGYYWHLRLGGI